LSPADIDPWKAAIRTWRAQRGDTKLITLEAPGLDLLDSSVRLGEPTAAPPVATAPSEDGQAAGEEEISGDEVASDEAPIVDPTDAPQLPETPAKAIESSPAPIVASSWMATPRADVAVEPPERPSQPATRRPTDEEDRMAWSRLAGDDEPQSLAALWELALKRRLGKDGPRQLEAQVRDVVLEGGELPSPLALDPEVCARWSHGSWPLVKTGTDHRCVFAQSSVEDLTVARVLDRDARERNKGRAARCRALVHSLRPLVRRGRVLAFASGLGTGSDCVPQILRLARREGLSPDEVGAVEEERAAVRRR
jgi:hypothetical protein